MIPPRRPSDPRTLSTHRRRVAMSLIEILVVVGILAVLALIGLAGVQRVRSTTLRVERENWHQARRLGGTEPRQLPIKVLFVGNSYTSTNDMPGMLSVLARDAGADPLLIVDSHTVGGATLKKHWDDGLALEKIQSGDWDFVVLQEQSQTPLPYFGRDKLFYPYARRFAKVIQEAGAIPMCYMTWARPDTPGPQALWTDSYANIAKELNAECAPAGMAFEQVKQSSPHVQMFQDRGGHPTPEATYLIACVFYAAIYVKSPEGVPNSLSVGGSTVTIAPGDAAVMQQAAWQAVQDVRKRVKPGWRR